MTNSNSATIAMDDIQVGDHVLVASNVLHRLYHPHIHVVLRHTASTVQVKSLHSGAEYKRHKANCTGVGSVEVARTLLAWDESCHKRITSLLDSLELEREQVFAGLTSLQSIAENEEGSHGA